MLQRGSVEVKEIMEDLLQGISLITEIDEEIIFSQLATKKIAIWSLMLASGYLKVLHNEFTEDGHFHYELGVTNFEVQIMPKTWYGTGLAGRIPWKLLYGRSTRNNMMQN